MITGAAEAGGGPLRSESARLPSVTLALAAPGLPVQLRWTTLRVQGPTLRDAALANGGNGSPPVTPRLLHQPLPRVPPIETALYRIQIQIASPEGPFSKRIFLRASILLGKSSSKTVPPATLSEFESGTVLSLSEEHVAGAGGGAAE